MAESTEQEVPETEDEKEQGAKDDKDGRADIPAEVAAALKKANKEAETYRRRLKELEDRDKSDQQKATERATQAEKDAADARTAYLRLKVGTTKGLAPSLAERLRGETEEEMAADADALLAAVKPNGKGSFDSGPKRQAPKATDMNALIRERMRR